MGSQQCFPKCESVTTVLSHHNATTLPRRKEQHRNPCRGTSLYTRSARTHFDSRALFSLLVVILSWSSLFVAASATEPHGDRPALLFEEADLGWKGSSLYLDQRPPPIAPLLMPPLHGDEDATKTLTAPPSKRSIATDPDATQTDFSIPQPFDTGLSNNFTSSCASFLSRLISSKDFQNCHPFSLLLQVHI